MKVGDWVPVMMRVRTINRMLPVYEVMLGSDDSLILWVEQSDISNDAVVEELQEEITRLKTENERLRGIAVAYGRHLSSCDFHAYGDCSCGFIKSLTGKEAE